METLISDVCILLSIVIKHNGVDMEALSYDFVRLLHDLGAVFVKQALSGYFLT